MGERAWPIGVDFFHALLSRLTQMLGYCIRLRPSLCCWTELPGIEEELFVFESLARLDSSSTQAGLDHSIGCVSSAEPVAAFLDLVSGR
jgi:hypothetical protein